MPRPRSDIDQRIVAAARARFLAEGVDGASLRAIAKKARTSLGMVTYYFTTKDDLFLAVVEEVYVEVLRDLEHILSQEGSLAPKLRGLSMRVASLNDHELEVIRLVVRESLLSHARFRRVFERFQRGHIPLLLGAIGKAIAAGELDETIPLPVMLGSIFGIIGVPQLLRRAVGAELPFAMPTPEATADAAVRVLFRGVRKRRKLSMY
jgi:AcrR family transcriptional regulator